MDFLKYIFSRGLPKTGQSIEYSVGDDGAFQAGWWVKRLLANNRTRFIAKTIDGDDIVFDRATGLMFAADGTGGGCNFGNGLTWENAVASPQVITFGGFIDWRLPNVLELLSIVNYGLMSPCISEPPFANTVDGNYWCSTTYLPDTLESFYVSFSSGVAWHVVKTTVNKVRYVRLGI